LGFYQHVWTLQKYDVAVSERISVERASFTAKVIAAIKTKMKVKTFFCQVVSTVQKL